jgi:molybdopterin synthase sulfur carrier subunit
MKVNFYATLRQITEQRTIEFALAPGESLDDLVAAVIQRFPDMRRELFDEAGKLYPHVHVFVNGRDAHYLEQEMNTPLKLEDKIDIFPAVGGG